MLRHQLSALTEQCALLISLDELSPTQVLEVAEVLAIDRPNVRLAAARSHVFEELPSVKTLVYLDEESDGPGWLSVLSRNVMRVPEPSPPRKGRCGAVTTAVAQLLRAGSFAYPCVVVAQINGRINQWGVPSWLDALLRDIDTLVESVLSRLETSDEDWLILLATGRSGPDRNKLHDASHALKRHLL